MSNAVSGRYVWILGTTGWIYGHKQHLGAWLPALDSRCVPEENR
ncbi:MAG: hypothetical protein ACE5HM_09925 [Acidiferrobacterales bacterium]